MEMVVMKTETESKLRHLLAFKIRIQGLEFQQKRDVEQCGTLKKQIRSNAQKIYELKEELMKSI